MAINSDGSVAVSFSETIRSEPTAAAAEAMPCRAIEEEDSSGPAVISTPRKAGVAMDLAETRSGSEHGVPGGMIAVAGPRHEFRFENDGSGRMIMRHLPSGEETMVADIEYVQFVDMTMHRTFLVRSNPDPKHPEIAASESGAPRSSAATAGPGPVTSEEPGPTAEPDDAGFDVNRDGSITITEEQLLEGASSDGSDGTKLVKLDNLQGGSCAENGDGTWTLLPDGGANDAISFDIVIANHEGEATTTRATVTVDPVPLAPENTDPSSEPRPHDKANAAGVLNPSTDEVSTDTEAPEALTLSVALMQESMAGAGEPGWTFVPAVAYEGSDAPILLALSDVPDHANELADSIAPPAPEQTAETPGVETMVTFSAADLLAGGGMEFEGLSIASVSVDPCHGQVRDNGDGTWTFVPAAGFLGGDVPLSFSVTDGTTTDSAMASLDVTTAGVDSEARAEGENALTFRIADLLASGPGTDGCVLQSFTQPENGSLVDNGDGTLSFTPALAWDGHISFDYVARDAEGRSVAAYVTLDIGENPQEGATDSSTGRNTVPESPEIYEEALVDGVDTQRSQALDGRNSGNEMPEDLFVFDVAQGVGDDFFEAGRTSVGPNLPGDAEQQTVRGTEDLGW